MCRKINTYMNNIIQQKTIGFTDTQQVRTRVQEELDRGWRLVNLEYSDQDKNYIATLVLPTKAEDLFLTFSKKSSKSSKIN